MSCKSFRKGPNKWRDRVLPVQILDEWVKSKNFPQAEWGADRRSVTIDGETYTLEQFGKLLLYELLVSFGVLHEFSSNKGFIFQYSIHRLLLGKN